jgi:hypothetical protein
MSDDNFASAKTGVGRFSFDGVNYYYGFLGECIVGNLIMGDTLKIINDSGTYSISDDGLIASALFNNNTYSVGINPSTPSEIFNIKVNDSNMFYIDTEHNKLVYEGTINAIDGTLGDLEITGTLTGGMIRGTTIITTDNSLYTRINNGFISSMSINLYDSYNPNLDSFYAISGRCSILGIGMNYYNGNGIKTFSVDSDGFINTVSLTCGTINCTVLNCTNLNNSTPITTATLSSEFLKIKDTFSYPVSAHSQDQSTINGLTTRLSSIEGRLSALEGG